MKKMLTGMRTTKRSMSVRSIPTTSTFSRSTKRTQSAAPSPQASTSTPPPSHRDSRLDGRPTATSPVTSQLDDQVVRPKRPPPLPRVVTKVDDYVAPSQTASSRPSRPPPSRFGTRSEGHPSSTSAGPLLTTSTSSRAMEMPRDAVPSHQAPSRRSVLPPPFYFDLKLSSHPTVTPFPSRLKPQVDAYATTSSSPSRFGTKPQGRPSRTPPAPRDVAARSRGPQRLTRHPQNSRPQSLSLVSSRNLLITHQRLLLPPRDSIAESQDLRQTLGRRRRTPGDGAKGYDRRHHLLTPLDPGN
jgi:hypothetical protein